MSGETKFPSEYCPGGHFKLGHRTSPYTIKVGGHLRTPWFGQQMKVATDMRIMVCGGKYKPVKCQKSILMTCHD